MENLFFFRPEEQTHLKDLYRSLLRLSGKVLKPDDCANLKNYLVQAGLNNFLKRDVFDLNPIITDMETSLIVAQEIGLTRAAILGVMLHSCVRSNYCTPEDVERDFGEDVAGIIHGLNRIQELYDKNPSIESENFRSLLLSFAEDMRVILIMIANRVYIMRQIKDTPNKEAMQKVAQESAYLYAPLAHKLGLYRLKSELEDLSLKYLEHDAYYHIKDKLNETKKVARRLYRELYRSDSEETGRCRPEIPHEGPHQEYPFHLAENETPEVWCGRYLRPVCHPYHSGFQTGARKDGVLAGIFHHHGHVSAESETSARLAVHPEEQRIREFAHHGARSGKQMGGGADPYGAYGRDCRTRSGCALAL